MKSYRISWYAVVEDESVLEGRSLIKAENQDKAIDEFYSQKMSEYRLKPYMISINSCFELQNDVD